QRWSIALIVALGFGPLGAASEEPDTVQPAEETAPAPGEVAPAPQQPIAQPEPAPLPAAPPSPERATALSSGPLLHGTLELSLPDAIKMGLENNLDVQVERYAPMIADLDLTAAWGAYDPELFAEGYYKDLHTPNAFGLSGVDTSI